MHVPRESPEPVFVDRTGRRRRLFAVAGAGGAVVLVLACLALAAGFTGVGAGSLPRLPEPAATTARGVTARATPSAPARPVEPQPTPATTSPADRPATVPPPATTSPQASATTTTTATATPTATHTDHRRVPSQKPSKRP